MEALAFFLVYHIPYNFETGTRDGGKATKTWKEKRCGTVYAVTFSQVIDMIGEAYAGV